EVASIERDGARAGFQLAGDQVEVGGLARAVRPHDGGQRPRLEAAGDGVDRDVAAEADGQVPGDEEAHCRVSVGPCPIALVVLLGVSEVIRGCYRVRLRPMMEKTLTELQPAIAWTTAGATAESRLRM